MAKSLRTSTSSTSGTVTIPTGLSVGDQCVVTAWSDTASATLTPPSSSGDSNSWTQIVMGSESGGAASTIGMWYATITSVPASFTVAGATIAGMTACAVNPGGETLGTPSLSTLASSVAAGSGELTSNAVNASADSYTFISWTADDASTVSVAPSGMTQEANPAVASGGLATYSIADANNASYTNSLTWSTSGTERMAGAISFPYTNAGPTINTQPTAQTARLNGDPTTAATFTVSATTSGGALSYQWQLEDSVGGGTYSNLSNGTASGITWSGVTSASATATCTATTQTGKRVRVNVTDSNGTTTSSAVVLTILTGPVLSAYSGTTNGSGVVSVNLTSDDALTANGEVLRITATCGDVVLRTYVRPS